MQSLALVTARPAVTGLKWGRLMWGWGTLLLSFCSFRLCLWLSILLQNCLLPAVWLMEKDTRSPGTWLWPWQSRPGAGCIVCGDRWVSFKEISRATPDFNQMWPEIILCSESFRLVGFPATCPPPIKNSFWYPKLSRIVKSFSTLCGSGALPPSSRWLAVPCALSIY